MQQRLYRMASGFCYDISVRVPLLDLKAQNSALRDEILAAIAGVVDSNQFVLGPEVERLEAGIACCGTARAIGVSSGTDALLVSLMALGIGPGDEVITTDYSFFATAGVIARLGATPKFVDIDPVSYNLRPEAVAEAVTPRTRAVIPVHLYGQCADMKPLIEIAAKHGLPVVEDAAQAIGAEYRDGRRAGSMGVVGCFSFYPTKNLGGAGDAGAVVTNDAALADKIRMLRVHGGERRYYHRIVGGNFRLDAVQAAVLNVKMAHLDRWTARRQENAARYDELFERSGLPQDAGIRPPVAIYRDSARPHHHIYNQYVIRVPERDKLREHLTKQEIGSDIYYPVPFHLQECFGNLGYRAGAFPESERAAAETLALPIYPELSVAQQEAVVSSIRGFYR